LAVVASRYLSRTAAESAEAQAEAEFGAEAQQTLRQIQSGLNTYLEAVRAGAVLLSANNEISGSEFRRFVDGLQLAERYPAMEGIGFAQCLGRPALPRLLRSFALEGRSMAPWPETGHPVACPTLFLEPWRRNGKAAAGFDLASEPVLEEVMATARDAARPAASRRLTTVESWEGEWRATVVLVLPVYRLGAPIGDVDARRRALVGFVYSPINTMRLFETLDLSTRSAIAFDIFESPLTSPDTLLGHWTAPATTARYEANDTVHMAGREWFVHMQSTEQTINIASQAAPQTLIVGLVLSFMLFLVTRAQVQAWETAARHEAELRTSAEALRQSEAEAQAANRAKDDFLATLSHELRTPLNVVLGWASMLRLPHVSENRLPHALDIIERNARQQAELIDDLLDVSRIVTGKLRVELKLVALTPIVQSVVDALRPSAEAKAIGISLAVPADSALVTGDADRLHQIVRNLVSNAIKFTPDQGQVAVALTRTAATVQLTVRDTGVGIAPEFRPHVFERFRQADSSTTRTHSGVGLGLSIARHLVELHDGRIDAQSEGTGKGAMFIVELPAAAPVAIPAPAPALPTGARFARVRLDGVRILVVDDEPNTRELLCESLELAGASVRSADSARRALDRLIADAVDVMVSDIAMPGEDGLWLMQQVRSLPGALGRTPAIALTALARSEDRARAMAVGYHVHLAKPIQLDELQSHIAALVGRDIGSGFHKVS
jgi:signal transduction histidine kinase/ActR/RegA family two-component response regulator